MKQRTNVTFTLEKLRNSKLPKIRAMKEKV